MQGLSKDGSVHVTDEFYNTVIMLLGAILSIIGMYYLLYQSIVDHKFWHILSFSIYGLALLNLFISSALHHGINGSAKTNHLFRQLDYFAVFIMIAGTMTPICLIVLRNPLGLAVLALVWILTIAGILLKALVPHVSKWILMALYLGMGWLGFVLVFPLAKVLPESLIAIILGGAFFTFGVFIYYFERPNPLPGRFGFHEIWHLHVIAGISCHYYLMYKYLSFYPS